MRDAPVEAGEILDGKFRVERVLGTGSMGVVVSADHLGLGLRVAIKFMRLQGARDPVQVERFLREARIAAMLRSQHVAKVLDVGVLESGAPYIVMELLEGQDLARMLEARGQLPVSEAVDYVLQACEAIAEAHAVGIVHRDLKPANLFVTRTATGSPCVKVLDFGVSKLVTSELALTGTGDAIGSPLYMSPEQMRAARDVDPRSDVWALGAILYELLAGQTPFHAETMIALCHRLLEGAPTPLERYRTDVPPPLAAAILRCVEKRREDRWPDVSAFAEELVPHASPRPFRFGSRASLTSAGSLGSTAPPALVASGARTLGGAASPRRRLALLAGGAVALSLAAAATLLLFTRESGPARVAPALAGTPAPSASAAPAPPAPPAPSASAPEAPASVEAAPPIASPSASSSAARAPFVKPRPRASAARPASSVDYDQR